jgi:hypothetical protein
MHEDLTETNYGKTLISQSHTVFSAILHTIYVWSQKNAQKNVSQILSFPAFYTAVCGPNKHVKLRFYFILT